MRQEGAQRGSYWFPGVVHLPDAQILQGDDSSGLLVLKERGREDSDLPVLTPIPPPSGLRQPLLPGPILTVVYSK